ncbi:MAG: hypothetical protein ACRDKS_12820, partial [Actinomycetota bacterium]
RCGARRHRTAVLARRQNPGADAHADRRRDATRALRSVASASGSEGGGLSVLALAGIALGVLLVGSTAIVYVKDRFLTTPPPS